MFEINKLYQGDCLEIMPMISDKSIDMILCDLPYGTTACSWDSVIPFEPLWAQYKRIIKDNGAIVLFGSQPFTTLLIMSNFEWFKYEWILLKNRPSDKFNAKNKPLKAHENIIIFSNGTTANCSNNKMTYNPQNLKSCRIKVMGKTGQRHHGTRPSHKEKYIMEKTGYPRSILDFPKDDKITVHPTQKPLSLFEYLIKTYTNEGETVLDNCAGSGTTAIACLNTKRNYILIEKEEKYCKIIEKRIKEHPPTLF